VEDVGRQVLFALLGTGPVSAVSLDYPVILYAEDLTPTETSQLDMQKVLGLVTAMGGPTSHSAILARGLGIPAVAGVGALLDGTEAGVLIGLDGSKGKVWVRPSSEATTELEAQRVTWLAQRVKMLGASRREAATADGVRIEVAANIGSVQDAHKAVEQGAEGVGLLRTEFLFLTRETAPDEDDQVDALTKIAAEMGNRPVIVRTLDIGGDKAVPYIQLAPEPNPFLGVRAIRLSLTNPKLFQTQLRAILRAGAASRMRVMFPMIASVEEIQRAKEALEQAHMDLTVEGVAHRWPIETGIMIEIPSAAVMSASLAKYIDFFSVGTNDLTQYTLAAERGNPALAHLADALHPAVLRLIAQTAEAANTQGKWTGVCGELAGDPVAIPVLVGIGIKELSMNAGAIPKAKAVLKAITMDQAREISAKVFEAENAIQARALASDFFQKNIQGQLP
jgi:phosphoenolpyruvate-protein phosphotransferase